MGRKTTTKKTDFLVNKIMGVFALTLIGSLLLAGIDKAAKSFTGVLAIINASVGFIVFGALLIVAGIVWMARDSKKDLPPYRYFSGIDLSVIGLLVTISSVLFYLFEAASVVRLLYIAFPAAAVLYVVFSLLQRVYFCQCVLCAISLPLIWGSINSVGKFSLLLSIVGLLLCVVYGMMMLIAQKKDGTVKLFGKAMKLADHAESYLAPFVTFAVLAAVFVLSMVFYATSVMVGSLLFYVMAGYLFLLTVYYIIRLV